MKYCAHVAAIIEMLVAKFIYYFLQFYAYIFVWITYLKLIYIIFNSIQNGKIIFAVPDLQYFALILML